MLSSDRYKPEWKHLFMLLIPIGISALLVLNLASGSYATAAFLSGCLSASSYFCVQTLLAVQRIAYLHGCADQLDAHVKRIVKQSVSAISKQHAS